MAEPYRTKNFHPGEVVLAEVRQYPFASAGRWVLIVVMVLGPFFFLLPLLNWGKWGLLIFFVVLIIGLLLLARTLMVLMRTVFVITSHRLIDVDQRGFFEQVVSETTYNTIQDVSFTVKGVRQTMADYGTIKIQTAGNQANLAIVNARHPAAIHELILKARAEAADVPVPEDDEVNEEMSDQEMLKLLKRMRSLVGDKEFQTLVKESKRDS